MGISADSFEHDDRLERAAHTFLRWYMERTGVPTHEHKQFVRAQLREVQDLARGKGREAVRFRSPYRRLATVWEILVIDWLDDAGDPARTLSLALCCARIVSHSLALPQETIDRITTEARAEMNGVIVRFHKEAGLSGATLDALSKGGAAQ